MLGLKALFRGESLEDKIPEIIFKLESTLSKLDNTSENLRREDNELFERCVEARVKGDSVHAMMYANECAEIRKIALLVISCKYALEQMVLRLHTVAKLGSVLVTVSPVIDVIKETKGRLAGIVPNVASNLNEANEVLARCLARMGTSASTLNVVKPPMSSEEAVKVLEEAKVAAETTVRERFPSIPDTLKDKASPEVVLTT